MSGYEASDVLRDILKLVDNFEDSLAGVLNYSQFMNFYSP